MWFEGGTRRRSLLRNCDISRKVVDSIPGSAVALRPTQYLRDMNTSKISLGVKLADAEGWQPYHLHVEITLKSGSLNLLELLGPVQSCTGIALPLWPVSGASWQIFKSGVLGSKVDNNFKRSEDVNEVIFLPYFFTPCIMVWHEQFNDGSTLTDSLEGNSHTLLRTESISVYLSGCFICAFAKFIVLE